MAVSEVSICNMALSRVGHHNQLAALSDNNEAGRQCNLHYEGARDSLLRSHPWGFATKRTKLITQSEAAQNITGATQANPVVITITAHGLSSGNRVRIADVGGMTEINTLECSIEVLTANTFSLLGVDGTSFTAYTSGGTATQIPAFGFSYWFDLPSDCLRVIRVEDDEADYKIENGRLLFNDDEAEMHYVAQITDPTVFDPLFVECLSIAVAIRIAQKLSDNANLKQSLQVDLNALMAEARTANAQSGGTPTGLIVTTWTNARA